MGDEFLPTGHDTKIREVQLIAETFLAKQKSEHMAEKLEHQKKGENDTNCIHELQLQLLHKEMELQAYLTRK